MRIIVITIAALFLSPGFSPDSYALEPVNALEDGFAVPSKQGMAEAAFFYPGTESYMEGSFAAGAWTSPFGISDLAVTSVISGTTIGRVGLSAAYSGSGFELYGEEHEKAGISVKPYDMFSLGIRVTRHVMRIRDFGHAEAWSSDAGVIVHPFDSVFIAASLEDLAGAELGESGEPVDGRSRVSVSWRMPGDVTLLASVTKVRRFDPSISMGFTAEVLKVLTLGVCGGNEPDRFDFLVGVNTSGIAFSYRGSQHRELGLSHGFSMSWKR